MSQGKDEAGSVKFLVVGKEEVKAQRRSWGANKGGRTQKERKEAAE